MPPVADQVTAVFAAFVTAAVNCCTPPGNRVAEFGDSETETAVATLTVTFVVAVTEPLEFVAVSEYVVVDDGVTPTETPVTEPGAGAMLNEVAPVTDQFSVVLCPA